MSAKISFLSLPIEIRDLIYEYIALDVGIIEQPLTQLHKSNCGSLGLVSEQVRKEYEDVLYSSAPIVRASVTDFDFSDVISFLDSLDERVNDHSTTEAPLNRPRELRIMLSLTASCHRRVNDLYQWLIRYTDHCKTSETSFETTYAISSDTVVAPVTLMRIIDELYWNWSLMMLPGPLKVEAGKLCNCLGEHEMETNRSRSVARNFGK